MSVSVLFNEPKLLKSFSVTTFPRAPKSFSALQRAEIAEFDPQRRLNAALAVSVLFNEPKLLKPPARDLRRTDRRVSVLFNEPKLLKYW